MSFKHSLLFTDGPKLLNEPIAFIDIGARDRLVEPFWSLKKKHPDLLKVIAFEPESAEHELLVNSDNGTFHLNKAVSHSEGVQKLYVTQSPGRSSMYIPNTVLLKQFSEKHSQGLEVVKEQLVDCVTLDSALRIIDGLGGSFLKSDTQGSEFDVCSGGVDFFTNKCVGLTMECWNIPVYEGIRTVDEVISKLRTFGFIVFNLQVGASWHRRSSTNSLERLPQIVGLDILAFKEADVFFDGLPTVEETMRFVVLADLWGFPDYALQLTNHRKSPFEPAIAESISNRILSNRKSRIFEHRPFVFHRDLLFDKLKLPKRFPLIH